MVLLMDKPALTRIMMNLYHQMQWVKLRGVQLVVRGKFPSQQWVLLRVFSTLEALWKPLHYGPIDVTFSILTSSSSSSYISLTCNSIKSFLLLHSLALSCHFFFLTFSPLMCKLFFGLFDTTSSSSFKIKQYNSWIDSVLQPNDPNLTNFAFFQALVRVIVQ